MLRVRDVVEGLVRRLSEGRQEALIHESGRQRALSALGLTPRVGCATVRAGSAALARGDRRRQHVRSTTGCNGLM
jgi:hypothetical protein